MPDDGKKREITKRGAKTALATTTTTTITKEPLVSACMQDLLYIQKRLLRYQGNVCIIRQLIETIVKQMLTKKKKPHRPPNWYK